METVRSALAILFLLAALPVTAQQSEYSVAGTVRTAEAKGAQPSPPAPVAGAQVTIEGGGQTARTDEQGRFRIVVPAEGEYIVVVSAGGYSAAAVPVVVPQEAPLDVLLERELIEMGTVEVTAERQRGPSKDRAASTVTKDELERAPIAGDVFNVLDSEEGVIVQDRIADEGYAMTGTNLSFSGSRRAFSVYGADSDFNTYYYDYIKIPGNHHYDSGAPIVPLDAISYLEIYKGVAPLSYGPGIGGFFRAVPDTDFTQDSLLEISPNTERFGVIWKKRFGDDSGLLLTATKSLTELFMPPLWWGFKWSYAAAGLDIFEGAATAVPSNGDLSLRFFAGGGANTLTLDALAYYDLVLIGLDMLGHYDMEARNLPYFAAVGAQWKALSSRSFINTLSSSVSYQRVNSATRADMDLPDFYQNFAASQDIPPEEMMEAAESVGSGHLYLNEQPDMSILAAEAMDSLSWLVGDSLTVTPGIAARYSLLNGTYEGHVDMDMSFYGLQFQERYDIPKVTYEEQILKLHGFLSADYARPAYELLGGVGYSWFPLHRAGAPSAEAEAKIDVDSYFTVAPRIGWSPGSYDEVAYLERRMNEKILGTATESSFGKLPASASSSIKLSFKPSEKTTLRVDPYFCWYYDLSGLALYAAYRDPYRTGAGAGDLAGQTEMLDPDVGYSSGAGLQCRLDRDPWTVDADYLLAFTRYHQRAGGSDSWFAPNTDVRHTLKGTVSRKVGKGGLLSSSLEVYFDKPFTPERVVDAAHHVLEKDVFNSARDLIPRFALGAKWEWDSKWRGLGGRYAISCRNILAFLNPRLSGMQEASTSVSGASTADFRNRKYEFLRTDLFDILTHMEISVGGTYQF